jgi:GNAT superfamily N-acetyltransferase
MRCNPAVWEQIMRLTICPARPEDAEAICEVYRLSILDLCAECYTVDQLVAWARAFEPLAIRMAIADGAAAFFIAVMDNRIIGFSVLYEDMVRAVYVHPIFVRQKVGAMLLKAVEEKARSQGLKRLHLTASLNSRLFYEDQGYRVIGEADFSLNDYLSMRCYKMEKDLKVPPK